ncbi:hypothetical protein Micbo1qcDRAFT_60006 [Microdochium bolleyi]|uniref:Uncharacterized protein n=1 Tax=Microdochium bolleyi TaxID=196109 RepID=A0A136J5C4_9PEZI|nr:hypothetical protein Micbo1qcDRAFT_60006 [Microdochium bolleyi]
MVEALAALLCGSSLATLLSIPKCSRHSHRHFVQNSETDPTTLIFPPSPGTVVGPAAPSAAAPLCGLQVLENTPSLPPLPSQGSLLSRTSDPPIPVLPGRPISRTHSAARVNFLPYTTPP